MCGLYGICGPGIWKQDIEVFYSLGIISQLRGIDGAGILKADARYRKKVSYKIYKGPVNFVSMVNWYKYNSKTDKNLLEGIFNTVFAGHNRAATVGDLTLENTHPFKCGNIIGFHNGTLVKSKYREKDKTDSELLIQDIDERGIGEVLPELYRGNAYALVLLDKNTGRLTFSRNDERTLYFCFNANREVMYWASESWMLRSILKRHNISILDEHVFYFEPNKSYVITPWDLRDYNKKDTEYDAFEDIIEHVPKFAESHGVSVPPGNIRQRWESQDWQSYRPSIEKITDGKIPHKKCAGCQKELSLVEEHYANRLGYETYICEDCNNHKKDEKKVG